MSGVASSDTFICNQVKLTEQLSNINTSNDEGAIYAVSNDLKYRKELNGDILSILDTDIFIKVGSDIIPNPTVSIPADNDTFLLGSSTTEDTGIAIEDDRLFFEKLTGAFRSGRQQTDGWNSINRGINSTALGTNNVASGSQSFTAGLSNETSGENSCILTGQTNIVSGNRSAIITGINCNNTGTDSTIMCGDNNDNLNNNNCILAGGADNTIENCINSSIINPNNSITNGSNRSIIGCGNTIELYSDDSCIMAGRNIEITSGSDRSFNGAGSQFSVFKSQINGVDSAINGGLNSTKIINSNECFIGTLTGDGNLLLGNTSSIGNNSNNSALLSGIRCIIGNNRTHSVICSGINNTISDAGVNTSGCTILGGRNNNINDNVNNATILGGGGVDLLLNGSTVNGNAATCLGGDNNTASGSNSLVCGRFANAIHDRSFVFSSVEPTLSTANNTFVVRCHGGARFITGVGLGVSLGAGQLVWASICDKELKENLKLVDCEDIIDKISQLPIYQYNYKWQHENVKNIGPTVQDWNKLFPNNKNSNRIYTLDMDGVLLAGIKGLLNLVNKENVILHNLYNTPTQMFNIS